VRVDGGEPGSRYGQLHGTALHATHTRAV
jgi:hypothetical protein